MATPTRRHKIVPYIFIAKAVISEMMNANGGSFADYAQAGVNRQPLLSLCLPCCAAQVGFVYLVRFLSIHAMPFLAPVLLWRQND